MSLAGTRRKRALRSIEVLALGARERTKISCFGFVVTGLKASPISIDGIGL
jgi:hypothetical protein